jgi:hypothetical protein
MANCKQRKGDTMKPDYEDTLIYLRQHEDTRDYIDAWGVVVKRFGNLPRNDRQNLIDRLITIQKDTTAREAEAFKGLRGGE